MKTILIISGLLLIVGAVNVAYAAEGDTVPAEGDTAPAEGAPQTGITDIPSIQLRDPLGAGTTIESLLRRIISWLITIAAPIAAGMVVYGAYQMLFSAGEPEKVKAGRNTILYTVIGYGIILISWGVVSIVENFLKGT